MDKEIVISKCSNGFKLVIRTPLSPMNHHLQSDAQEYVFNTVTQLNKFIREYYATPAKSPK